MLDFIINKGIKRKFDKNSIIVREGKIAHSVYILIQGEVEILKRKDYDNDIVITTLHEGAIIGEMSVFLDQKRSASIRAKTPVIMSEISNSEFVNAVMTIPGLYKRLMNSFVQKIVETNNNLEKTHKEKHILILLNILTDIYHIAGKPSNGLIVKLSTISQSIHISNSLLLCIFENLIDLKLIHNFRKLDNNRVFFNLDLDDFTKYIQSIV
jgi:CRP-like cAMP-binding protein